MIMAPDRKTADRVKDNFVKVYEDKYPKATECLAKDWAKLTTFFDYPAKHWTSLRTTNPIESSFATVKLRTRKTKGAGSVKVPVSTAFKLLLECEKKWRKIRGAEEIQSLLTRIRIGTASLRAPHRVTNEA